MGLALSVIVLAGILSVYLPAVRSWGVSSDLAEIHDTEAILHELLGDNIRQSGLLGCNINPTVSNIVDGINPAINRINSNVNTWAFNPASFANPSFMAFAANDTTNAGSFGVNGQRLNDGGNGPVGDYFFTLAPTSGYYRVTSASPPGTTPSALNLADDLSPGTPPLIETGDFFIVNDCNNTVIVRASGDGNGVLTYINNALPTYTHPNNTTVNPFSPELYYLGSYNPPGATTPPVPTLYRRTIDQTLNGGAFTTTDNPILTGVENLRVEYGVFARDANGNPFISDYFTPNNLPAGVTMANVSAVRITVMIQSAGSNNAAEQTSLIFPDLNGNPVDCYGGGTPNQDACPDFVTDADGRRRSHKVISFTYALPRFEQIKKN